MICNWFYTISNFKHQHLPSVFVEVALSRDQQILAINCNSRTSSEVLLVDTTASSLEPFLVQPRQLDLLYHVEHWRRLLVILANTGPGQEYQVVQFNSTTLLISQWAISNEHQFDVIHIVNMAHYK